jgi:hypothetical protein
MRLLAILCVLLLLPLVPAGPGSTVLASPSAPVLKNPGFECGDGYHDEPGVGGMVANGWTGEILAGHPVMNSTQMWATYRCNPSDMGWEKLEGHDSNIFLANGTRPDQDFDAPPFDVVLYQAVEVSERAEYSLSAWMSSLCGGSSTPSDCPAGAYIAKMAGLDAWGGTDPVAGTVQWTEDRRPHTEVGWANLSLATTAETSKLTVFLRVNSPFHHHGNLAFADAVKLVRSPTSQFTKASAQGNNIALTWAGSLGEDIPLIPATNHKLSFELQVRSGGGSWNPWLTGQGAGSETFAAPRSCRDQTYQFRVRAWAIQPDGQPGAFPNHHFMGVWHVSDSVQIPGAAICTNSIFLPATRR